MADDILSYQLWMGDTVAPLKGAVFLSCHGDRQRTHWRRLNDFLGPFFEFLSITLVQVFMQIMFNRQSALLRRGNQIVVAFLIRLLLFPQRPQ